MSNIPNKKNSSTELLKLAVSSSDSVNAVNKYFASIGKSLAEDILKSNFHEHASAANNASLSQPPLSSMALFNVEHFELERIISNLKDNCAIGWDGIPNTVIKSARHVLIPILVNIFNNCLTHGIFPKAFKKAIVHPIFKSGDRNSTSNYRPISVLTVLSKIFEKIINNRLINFLDSNNILSSNQYGFRQCM